MAVAYVGSASNAVTTATTNTVSYSSAGGNQLVCCITSSNANVTGITDTAGNAWVRALKNGSAGPTGEIWVTVSTAPSAVTSVTVTIASAGTFEAAVGEYSGVAQCTNVGAIVNNTTSTNPTISLTLTAANNFFVAWLGANSNVAMTSSVGNLRATVNAGAGSRTSALIDNTTGSPSSVTCTGAHASVTWSGVGIELKPLATPLISSVTRGNNGSNQGLLAGGTAVTITGPTGFAGFQSGATVTFDGNAATSVVVVNEHTITCNNPSRGSTGLVNVVVTNTNTLSATVVNGWRYCKVAYVGGPAPAFGSNTTLNMAYASSGNAPLFVIVNFGAVIPASAAGGFTITDDAGNGYHPMAPFATASLGVGIFMSNSLTPSVITQFQVTGTGNFEVVCAEYEGVAFAQLPFTLSNGTSTSMSVTATLSAADNVLIGGMCASLQAAWTVTAGNNRGNINHNTVGARIGLFDDTSTTASSITLSATITSTAWACVAIELSSTPGIRMLPLTHNGGLGVSAPGQATFTTGTLYPIAGQLLILNVYSLGNSAGFGDYPVISGCGIPSTSWRQIAQAMRPTQAMRTLWWCIAPPGTTSGALTFTYSKNQTRCGWVLDGFVNYDSTTSTSWCVQLSSAASASTNSFDISLATALQDTQSLCYGALMECSVSGANLNAPAGFNGFKSVPSTNVTAQGHVAAINNPTIIFTPVSGTALYMGVSIEITAANLGLKPDPLAQHTLPCSGVGA